MTSKSRALTPRRTPALQPASSVGAVSLALAMVGAVLALAALPDVAAASDPASDPAALVALRSSDEAFNRAARSRDRAAVAKLLAEGAVFFADALHRGRQAFLEGWQPLWEGKYDFSFDASVLQATVAESGDLGFTLGTVETRYQHPVEPEPTVITGHYLNVWALDGEAGSEGEWRLQASTALVVHAELGAARDPRSGLMTAWPELADQIDAHIEIDWRPERTSRAASGELAYSLGRYAASFENDEGRQAGEGYFLAVWQRDAAGAWQLAAEGFTPPELKTEAVPTADPAPAEKSMSPVQ
ncbi:MAG: nuclear transport factor 2 family protein [Acidobacteriota bacterium]